MIYISKMKFFGFYFFIYSFMFFFLILFYHCSSILVFIFLPPLSPTPPHPTSHPQLYTFCLCHGYVIHVSWCSFLIFPPLSLSRFPSTYCQLVLYFNVSGSILLACLFCWLGFTYRWDHMVFVFHCLAHYT